MQIKYEVKTKIQKSLNSDYRGSASELLVLNVEMLIETLFSVKGSREAASKGPTVLHIHFCSLSNNSKKQLGAPAQA